MIDVLPRSSQTVSISLLSSIGVIVVLSFWFVGRKTSKLILDPARVATKLSSVNKNDSSTRKNLDLFDIIIVGGGTAGCVLASRLSEESSLRVLLIEAGGSGKDVFWSRVPVGYPLLFRTKHAYQIHTEPQGFADGKRKFWPRGKMLGGCSSINGQVAQYGSPEDFDEWGRLVNDESWSWQRFSQYFRKFEAYITDPRYPDVDTTCKGTSGPIEIGYNSYTSNSGSAFIEACINIGISLAADFNSLTGTMGVNKVLTYIDRKARRVSTETGYLSDTVLARPNLSVIIHAQATRVVFESTPNGPQAVAVEFSNSTNKIMYQVRCRKEVIVAGGTIHSPHILMLSGIGPSAHLKEHGIPLVKDLPGVGSHLVDHPSVNIRFKDKSGLAPRYLQVRSFRDGFNAILAAAQYFVRHEGPLAINWGECAAFFRSDDERLFAYDEYPEKLRDTTSGPQSPDLEICTLPVANKDQARSFYGFPTFDIHPILLRPSSKGTVRLVSADPWTNPSVDPHYCESSEDVEKLLRGVKLSLKLGRTEPLASLIDRDNNDPELDHNLHFKSDAELREVVKDRVETLYHPASTCRMAPLDQEGVVDSQLRVYGIHGLRVCDASIFPFLVSGHTAGAVIACAEKLADVVKSDLGTI